MQPDLHFCNLQPEPAYTTRQYSLHLPREGWPGWVDWVHVCVCVCLCVCDYVIVRKSVFVVFVHGFIRLWFCWITETCFIHLTVQQRLVREIPGWPQTWKTWNTRGFLWTWKTQGILGEFCEFCTTSGKNCNKLKVFLVHRSHICVKQLSTG